MKILHLICKLTIPLLIAAIGGLHIAAQGIEIDSAGNLLTFSGTGAEVIEPSAVEPIGDGKYLLVADDKAAKLSIVETLSGKIIKLLAIPQFSVEKPKWEAMAYDGEFFYLIGSHAVKLDDTIDKLTKQLAARSHLIRFKLKNLGDDGSKLEIESPLELDVTSSLGKLGLYNSDPNTNKVKIEGLAVRTNAENKKELFFALREPHDSMQVYFAQLPAAPIPNEKLSLKPFFSFEAGKIGKVPFRLSSIEYVQQWKGFFLITSTEDDSNVFYGNALWFVGNETLQSSQSSSPPQSVTPEIVWLFDTKMKAEGLCVLPKSTDARISLALVYDNDVKDTGILGKLRFIELVRNQKK